LERKCKWGHTFGFKIMGARENIIMEIAFEETSLPYN
jgi:hypothetical protein